MLDGVLKPLIINSIVDFLAVQEMFSNSSRGPARELSNGPASSTVDSAVKGSQSGKVGHRVACCFSHWAPVRFINCWLTDGSPAGLHLPERPWALTPSRRPTNAGEFVWQTKTYVIVY